MTYIPDNSPIGRSYYYYAHFTDKKSEVWGGEVNQGHIVNKRQGWVNRMPVASTSLASCITSLLL